MPIIVTCACGKKLMCADGLAGRVARCPACQAVITIPGQPPTAGPGAAKGPVESPAAGQHEQPPAPASTRPQGSFGKRRALAYSIVAALAILLAVDVVLHFAGHGEPKSPAPSPTAGQHESAGARAIGQAPPAPAQPGIASKVANITVVGQSRPATQPGAPTPAWGDNDPIIVPAPPKPPRRMSDAEAFGQTRTTTAPHSDIFDRVYDEVMASRRSSTSQPDPWAQFKMDAAQPTTKPADMPPDKLFERCSPAVVRIVVRDKDHKEFAFGSGFLVSAGGGLVTNYHVVEGASSASVIFANNPKVEIEVEGILAADKAGDLALLVIRGKDLPHLQLADGPPPKVGTKVYAIGNPEGMTNTLSDGLVSGHRSIPDPGAKPDIFDRVAATQPSIFHQLAAKQFAELTLLQTTASISHGSSGGPLLTADGQVVGVTQSFLEEGQSLNFAIPARRVAELFRKAGKMQTIASLGPKDPISSIWMAATFGDLNEVKANLAAGVDINAKDNGGMTALHWAAVTGKASTPAERKAQASVARFLLAHGADADARSKDGSRPLHVAVDQLNLEVATVLADGGAALTARDNDGYTPLHLAAANKGAEPLARLLLDRGVDANVRGHDGETPLHVAVRHSKLDAAKLLLDSGGNVDARETSLGFTPLHLATCMGKTEMGKLLLDRGAKVDAGTKDGKTSLHLAAMKNQAEMARLLLKQLASVDAQDDDGWTPLHAAAYDGSGEVAKLLLDNSAAVNAKTTAGSTPLDLALSPDAHPPAGQKPAAAAPINAIPGYGVPGSEFQNLINQGLNPQQAAARLAEKQAQREARIRPAGGQLPGGIMADLLRKYGGRTGSP